MLSLYERLKYVLTSNLGLLVPLDVSKMGDVIVHRAYTEDGGLSLYHSSLSNLDQKHPVLPQGLANWFAKLSSDDKWTLTAVDFDGSDRRHLCRIESQGVLDINEVHSFKYREVEPQRLNAYIWSPRNDGILYTGALQDNVHISYIENDFTSKPRVLLDDVQATLHLSWTHSDLALALGFRDKTLRQGRIIVFNVETGECIVDMDNIVTFNFYPEWHPNEMIFPYLEPTGENGKLTLYNVKSDEKADLNQPEGAITTCHWSGDGNTLLIGAEKDGRSTISTIDTARNEMHVLDLPVGNNYALNVRKWNKHETLIYAHTDAARSVELWAYNLKDGTNTQLSHWQDSVIGSTDFPVVPSESLYYPSSHDGLTIHGFFFKPAAPPPPDGYPLLLWIHGGPMLHISDSFSAWFQILTQEGFAVFAPNYRGSTGYGNAFMMALHKECGRADLVDVSSGADYIIENYPINPKKVAIAGASYGGFMTLAALAFQPDRWAAGYATAPISDMWYMYEHGDAVFKSAIGFLWGNPEENKDLMLERSPISKVDDVRAPLGIHIAANDSITPMPPVLEFANRLYARNHDLTLSIEPLAGHSTTKKDSTIRHYAARIHFFKRVLHDD